jgi:predicted  nucleic acid-binding Zn-ribbon protein
MSERAQVTSVESLETFRARLVVFLSKARATIEEVTDEIARLRMWLETEQRSRWEGEIKAWRRRLDQAQQELFSARLSKLQEASAAQYLAFHRAQRGLRDAEEKLAVVKKWSRDLPNHAEPLARQVEQLHSFLTVEMARSVAYLNDIIKALEAYAEAGRFVSTGPTPTASAADTPAAPEDPASPPAEPKAAKGVPPAV